MLVKKVKISIIVIGTLLLHTSCANPSSSKASANSKNGIKEIIVYSHSGTVSPMYQNSSTTTLESNLTLTYVKKDFKNTVVKRVTKRVSKADYESIINRLKGVRLSTLKGKEHPPTVGGGSGSVTIITNSGNYAFSNNYKEDYPREIEDIANKINKLY